MPLMRACANGLRTMAPNSMPGSLMSSTYWPWPRMNLASSLRSSEVPMPCSLSSRSFSSFMSPMTVLRCACRWRRRAASGRRGGLCGGELLGCRLHGLDDVLVPGAAAQVARDPVADLLLARVGVLLQQPVGARDHPWRAVAALQAVLLVECLLQRVQHAALLEAFDRQHVGAVALHCQHRARLDRHAVDVNRAGAAVRGLAADV